MREYPIFHLNKHLNKGTELLLFNLCKRLHISSLEKVLKNNIIFWRPEVPWGVWNCSPCFESGPSKDYPSPIWLHL